jgi:hypothetical protein
MRIEVDSSGLRQSKWYEYLLRFLFGGTVTALAGIIAKRFGPGIGGLFLAFPAILSASATLIEKHERQKKERAGKNGVRAKLAAGVDSIGASMGAVGLAVFALIVWLRLPDSGYCDAGVVHHGSIGLETPGGSGAAYPQGWLFCIKCEFRCFAAAKPLIS